MMLRGALLDTGFFIRLLLRNEPLHKNADDYYRYFLEQEVPLFISTIAIAEYCVKGNENELPLQQVQVLPFNYDEAIVAGKLTRTFIEKKESADFPGRKVVINDLKMFAQAHVHTIIDAYVTADSESRKLYDALKKETPLHFQFIDITSPHSETFGILL